MIVAAAVLLALGVLVYTLAVRPADAPVPAPDSPGAYLDEKKAAINETSRTCSSSMASANCPRRTTK